MRLRAAISTLLVLVILVIGTLSALDSFGGDSSGDDEPTTEAASGAGPPEQLEVAAIVAVDRPAGVTAADGAVWVTSSTAAQLVRIDTESSAVTQQIGLEGRPGLAAANGGRVYVAEAGGEALLVVDPAIGGVVRTLPLPAGVLGITFADGDVWVLDIAESNVVRIDGLSGDVRLRIAVRAPTALAADETGVWVASFPARQVTKIDPETSLVVAAVRLDDAPASIAVGGGAVWVSHQGSRSVTRIDAKTGEVVGTIELDVDGEPLLLVASDDGLWVLTLSQIVRVNPDTNRVDAAGPVELVRHPGPGPYVIGGIAVDGGSVWIADTHGSAVLRFAPR